MPSDDGEDNGPEAASIADPGTPSALPSGARDAGGSHSTEGDAGASVSAKTTIAAGGANDADASSVGAPETRSQAGCAGIEVEATTTTRPTKLLTEEASSSEEYHSLAPTVPTIPPTPPTTLTSPPGKRSGPSDANAAGAGDTRAPPDDASEVAGVPVGTPGVALSGADVAEPDVADDIGKAGEDDKMPPGATPTDAKPCGVGRTTAHAEVGGCSGTRISTTHDRNRMLREHVLEVSQGIPAATAENEGNKKSDPGSPASCNARPLKDDGGSTGHQRTSAAAASSSGALAEEEGTTPSNEALVWDEATVPAQTSATQPADDQATGAESTTEDPATRAPLAVDTPIATPRKPRLGGRGAPPQTPTPAASRWVSMSERPRTVSQTMAMAMSGNAGDVEGVTEPNPGPSTTALPAASNDDDEWVAFVRAQLVRLFPDFHKYAGASGGLGSDDDGESEQGDDSDEPDEAPPPATRSFRAELASLRDEIALLRGVVGEVAGSGSGYETYTDADADVADVDNDADPEVQVDGSAQAAQRANTRAVTPPLPESVASTPLSSSTFLLPNASKLDSAGPDTDGAGVVPVVVAGLTADAMHAALDVVRLLDARGGAPRPDAEIFAVANLKTLTELTRTLLMPPSANVQGGAEDIAVADIPLAPGEAGASKAVVIDVDAPEADFGSPHSPPTPQPLQQAKSSSPETTCPTATASEMVTEVDAGRVTEKRNATAPTVTEDPTVALDVD